MRFHGDPEDRHRTSVSRSRRRNLPETVEPGVAYRDVRVDYRLASRLDGVDLARLGGPEPWHGDAGEGEGAEAAPDPEETDPVPGPDDGATGG